MKLHEILSKYYEFHDRPLKSSHNSIVAAILTHAWVLAKLFSKEKSND